MRDLAYRLQLLAALLAACLMFGGAPTAAQQTGSLDFTAHVSPTDGQAEPARGMTVYLLRKSFTDICRESEASEPVLQMDPFIEKLEVSAPMKAWMKEHRRVELSGTDFPKLISPQDIFDVPEFSDAFAKRSELDPSVKLPPAKYLSIDKKKHPDKYQAALDQYHDALREYIKNHPEMLDTMYLALEPVDPGPRWTKMQHDRKEHIRRHALELAGLRYLAAKTETDLEGRGHFSGVAPGAYWLSTLESQAAAGDVRVRWDFAVRVTAGRVSAAELSNLNAVEPRAP
ncbi:MAG TPA: hypothetical protein VFO34_14610 [Candidatus Acidoferrales bacterium]|nr:hypothetical protein [Candidatus Acidoferrales bacterium]